MLSHPTLKLPTRFPIGESTIHLNMDETSILTFINGAQAGKLAYAVYRKRSRVYDCEMVFPLIEHHHGSWPSVPWTTGYTVATILTLIEHGTFLFTLPTFRQGYQAGLEAYCSSGHPRLLSLTELCCLVSWKHHPTDESFNGGYVAGFVKGLTQGINAMRTCVNLAEGGWQ